MAQEWQNLADKDPRYKLDQAFYEGVRKAKDAFKKLEGFVIPPGEGRGFVVKKGCAFRVIAEAGPQIGSVAFWNANDPRETFKAARTWAHEGAYVKPFAQMLSGEPWVRPMMTCVDQSPVSPPGPEAYQHHTIGTHCSHEIIGMWFGRPARNSCRQNLVRAIAPHGLAEHDLHDNVNVHQKVSIADPARGHIHLAASAAKAGDFVEFFAEMDLLVAVSVCPLGDGTADPTGDLAHVRALRIETFETGFAPKPWPPTHDWRPAWKGRWEPPGT